MNRRRDPLFAALLGIVVIAVLVIGVFRVDALPFGSSRTTTYRAEFSDAGGLKPGDPVEISGIKVGTVRDIEVSSTHVLISFGVRHDIRLGGGSHAAVKVGSLLGAKYLEVEPSGTGRMDDGATIPLARTTPAYDIVEAFSQLTETAEEIDKNKVAQALDTITNTFRDSPAQIRGAMSGLADLSATIADRDSEVKDLLRHARVTTAVLAQRRGDIGDLLVSSRRLLAELDGRRAAIHRLLVTTTALADQLDGLVSDNQATLTPALNQLHGVVAMLQARQDQLRMTVKNMEIFTRVFTNTVGSGPWFDAIIPNLPTRVSIGSSK